MAGGKDLHQILCKWDKDGNGEVSKDEFAEGLKALGVSGSKKEFYEIFDSWDMDSGGTLDATELRVALLSDTTMTEVRRTRERRQANLVQMDSGLQAALQPCIMELLQASSLGDVAVVAQILTGQHSTNVSPHDLRTVLDYPVPNGLTALHKAAINGNIGVVQTLLQMGMGVRVCDDQGRTALMLAAINGKTAVVQELLKKAGGPDVEEALRFAVIGGHVTAVEALVDAIEKAAAESNTKRGSIGTGKLAPAWAAIKNPNGQDLVAVAQSAGQYAVATYLERRKSEAEAQSKAKITSSVIEAFSKAVQPADGKTKIALGNSKLATVLRSAERRGSTISSLKTAAPKKQLKKTPRTIKGTISIPAMKRVNGLLEREREARVTARHAWDEDIERETKVRAAFAIFDADCNGVVSKAELRAVLTMPSGSGGESFKAGDHTSFKARSNGNSALVVEVEAIFEDYDLNEDGVLQFSEFEHFWKTMAAQQWHAPSAAGVAPAAAQSLSQQKGPLPK